MKTHHDHQKYRQNTVLHDLILRETGLMYILSLILERTFSHSTELGDTAGTRAFILYQIYLELDVARPFFNY